MVVEFLMSEYYFDMYRSVKEEAMASSGTSGLTVADLMPDEETDLIFKALSSKPRRQIITLLATDANEGDTRCCSAVEVCGCAFAEKLGVGAPTVSHHMKVLVRSKLVSSEKRGSWVYYRLRLDTVERVSNELMALVGCRTSQCS